MQHWQQKGAALAELVGNQPRRYAEAITDELSHSAPLLSQLLQPTPLLLSASPGAPSPLYPNLAALICLRRLIADLMGSGIPIPPAALHPLPPSWLPPSLTRPSAIVRLHPLPPSLPPSPGPLPSSASIPSRICWALRTTRHTRSSSMTPKKSCVQAMQ